MGELEDFVPPCGAVFESTLSQNPRRTHLLGEDAKKLKRVSPNLNQ
jgi:hypothetical protein